MYAGMNNEEERTNALKLLDDNVNVYDGIKKTVANYNRRTFLGTDTNISVRSDYNRGDYDYYRLGEAIPEKQEDIILLCMKAYDRISIVRNIIDLMADFAMQGIRLVHPNKSIQKFYREWFKYVDGNIISERFLNYLYRIGNVVVKKQFGKVSPSIAQQWKKSVGLKEEYPILQTKNFGLIPSKYNFLHPMSLEVIGGELAMFVGKPVYALKISSELGKLIREATRYEQYGLTIPEEISSLIKKGAKTIPLDQDKLSVFYYRKDDWLKWANPMTYSVLNSLMMLEKMHLADISALDGVISNIRLWRIGHLDGIHSILPTRAAIAKLRNILANNVGGGTMDLVWGPELDFKESNTQVHNFLGPEKYQQVMAEIFSGYGIPSTLTGGGAGSQGYTNNFVAMKTLLERLRYGRNVLLNFWNEEIKIVQKTMGFDKPASVVFDETLMSDDAAYKTFLLAAVDRDVLSEEEFRERCGFIDEVERAKIKREFRKRTGDNVPNKASPYHNAMKDEELKKLVLQNGGVAPSEMGIKLKDKKEGEKTLLEHRMQMEQFKSQQKAGRPNQAKDTKPRKQKTVKPKTTGSKFVNELIWANSAQKIISDMVLPAMLHAYNKKDIRALTDEQKEKLELLKYSILTNLEPLEHITAERVYNLLNSDCKVSEEILTLCNLLTLKFVKTHARQPSIDEVRQIQASAFILVKDGTNGENSNNP